MTHDDNLDGAEAEFVDDLETALNMARTRYQQGDLDVCGFAETCIRVAYQWSLDWAMDQALSTLQEIPLDYLLDGSADKDFADNAELAKMAHELARSFVLAGVTGGPDNPLHHLKQAKA